jgi:glycosyltransferase involved in cell wall biosynthesis
LAVRSQYRTSRRDRGREHHRRGHCAGDSKRTSEFVGAAAPFKHRQWLMRILQIASLLTPDGAFGGPTRVAINQCVELIRQGHTVTLAAGTRGYRDPPTEVEGIPLQLFKTWKLFPRVGFVGMVAPGLVRWANANAGEYDVVHIHFGRDLMVLPAATAVGRRQVPYVLQTHGMVIPSRNLLAGPLDALITRRLLTGAAAVFYLTDLEREQLLEVADTDLHLVRLVNGVPEYPPANHLANVPEVIFVARLNARKRPCLFIAMAKQLLKDGVNARFSLIGPDEGEGPAVRAAIGGEQRISWQGPIESAALPQRMAEASIYVLPSEREPYPMTVLEAMSIGLPVVVCDDCGLAPVIAQTGSGVVAQGTASALADAVTAIMPDAARYGMRARDTAQREFGMKSVGDQLIRDYERARGNRCPPR